MKEIIVWKFQWWTNFWFLIPEDRDYYGWDFYVNKSNFWEAVDWDKVEWVEIKTKWKKPEVKIVKVFWKEKSATINHYVEWIYSAGDGNFWFIDVEGQEKWFFVHWKNSKNAKDGDKVKARIVDFKGKKEGIIENIFENKNETLVWEYKDMWSFGFVLTKDSDIFIAGLRRNGAEEWDKVETKIIKTWWKNPEGIILRVL